MEDSCILFLAAILVFYMCTVYYYYLENTPIPLSNCLALPWGFAGSV